MYDYPLGHYLVLGVVYAPYVVWLALTGGFASAPSGQYPYGLADPTTTLTLLMFLARAVSAVMGTGIVVCVHSLTKALFDRRAATAAAAVAACGYALIFYSHTDNLDVPYLFWAMLALVSYAQLWRENRLRHYLQLGACSAWAVATKDQAYALFLLLPLPLLWLAWHRQTHSFAPGKRLVTVALSHGLWSGVLASVTAFTLGSNLLFDWPRFVRHVEYLIVNPTFDRYLDPGLVADCARLLTLTTHYLIGAMGLPLFLAGVAGLIDAAWRRPAATLWLAVPLFSYGVVFIFGNLFYVHARHVLPLALLFSVFAGYLLAEVGRSPRLPIWLRRIGLAAMLGHGLLYGFSANLMLLNDSRQLAGQWLTTNVAPGARLEVYSPPIFLPEGCRPTR
jgi:4-amino-4-deoxy-L-arabinose transferase-like glycosyltransferase